MTTVEINSLRQLAKVLGVSQPFLSQVRAGKRPLPEALGERVAVLGAYHLLMGDKQSVVSSGLERAMGIEPTTACLEGALLAPLRLSYENRPI